MVAENSDYHTKFKAFEKLTIKIPGVMAVVEDDILYDTILVYIDKETCRIDAIPSKYNGLHIDIIDAREQYTSLSAAYEKIKEHYQSDLTHSSVSHFGGMIDFLRIVIDLYELQLSEPGEKQ